VGLVAALAGACFIGAAFLVTQPELVEITSDMINVTIAMKEYEADHGEVTGDLAALGLGVAAMTDPWGQRYALELTKASSRDDLGFDVISAGPDSKFDTQDDLRLSRLGRHWELALEGFDETMEDFGERMERIKSIDHRSVGACEASASDLAGGDGPRDRARAYVEAAIRELGSKDRVTAIRVVMPPEPIASGAAADSETGADDAGPAQDPLGSEPGGPPPGDPG
jgi:hypothetical protein